MPDRDPALVICHTILHNVFRSHMFRKDSTMEGFKRWIRSKFISDFLYSSGIDGKCFAYTTPKAFKEFEDKMVEEGNNHPYIKFVKNFILEIKIPSTDHIPIDEGVVVIAEILSGQNNFDTYIVTSMKEGKETVAVDYYGEGNSWPFRIMDLEETVLFLHVEFPVLS